MTPLLFIILKMGAAIIVTFHIILRIEACKLFHNLCLNCFDYLFEL